MEHSKGTAFADFAELRGSLVSKDAKTLVVAAAHDVHTLEAVYAASDDFPMRYILVGDRERILEFSSKIGTLPDDSSIIDCDDDASCAQEAVRLIREGRGDALMKGLLETGTLLKAVLDKDCGIREPGIMSHLAVLEVPSYHKLIVITDGGMITSPTLEQKAEIAKNAVTLLKRLGAGRPKIAAISFSESINEKFPETIDAAELTRMCERGELGECVLEGPISFDLAVSAESAKIKGYLSSISGDADVLLVPNITVGNVLAKGLLYWGGAKMAGCVVGAKVPIVLVSRGASSEEKLLSIMLCLAG